MKCIRLMLSVAIGCCSSHVVPGDDLRLTTIRVMQRSTHQSNHTMCFILKSRMPVRSLEAATLNRFGCIETLDSRGCTYRRKRRAEAEFRRWKARQAEESRQWKSRKAGEIHNKIWAEITERTCFNKLQIVPNLFAGKHSRTVSPE